MSENKEKAAEKPAVVAEVKKAEKPAAEKTVKPVQELATKSDVKAFTKAIAKLVDGAPVSVIVTLPIDDYNKFIETAEEVIASEDVPVRSNPSGAQLVTTIEQNNVTVHVKALFA